MKDNYFSRQLKKLFKTEDVFWVNEVRGNRVVAVVMLITCILFIISWYLNQIGVYELDPRVMNAVTLQIIFETLIPFTIGMVVKGERKWIKYLFLIEFTIVLARVDSLLGFNVPLLMILPVVLAALYYSEAFTVQIAVFTTILFGISSFTNAYFGLGVPDLNYLPVPQGSQLVVTTTLLDVVKDLDYDHVRYAYQYMMESFLPKFMNYALLTTVCVILSKRGKEMVLAQETITKKNSRIESELSLASDIQLHMLPSIFPAFPENSEFDIYAVMDSAKEVGGDFYDYFKIGDKELCMVVADVSGKGVPASLIMVIARTLIKNHMQAGMEPWEAFTKVNSLLLEGDDNNFFVTAWMGVLDLETGIMRYVNAGHNPPVRISADGEITYLRSKPQLVLACIDGMRYKQQEIQLDPGDKLVLYTDGVTESTNQDLELFGEERLLEALKPKAEMKPKQMVEELLQDLKRFSGDAEQFDDITILSFHLFKNMEPDGMIVREYNADDKELANVLAFVEEFLEEKDCAPDVAYKISLAVEEIFANISHYAYKQLAQKLSLGIKATEDRLVFRFSDAGLPFNPLEKPDVDIEQYAQEDGVGGLGIYLVKQNMDKVSYEYRNGKNELTMEKML